MTGLTLALDVPDTVPLDEALVVVVTLYNDSAEPVTTSSRLNLVEDDLSVLVSPSAGGAVRAAWPWPVDSALRQVTLAPGQALVGSALLLWASAGESLFPTPGAYSIVAEFTPLPGDIVRSDVAEVRRPAPLDDAGRARQRALEDPSVVQSMCSLSVLGSAEKGLALLAHGDDSPIAQLLARTVTTVTAELDAAIEQAIDRSTPTTAAAALTAVLPTGLFAGDERLTAARQVAGDSADRRVEALLTGKPITLA